MHFTKYHALGNDYLVLEPAGRETDLTEDLIRGICHRHYGVGSDGALVRLLEAGECDYAVLIFNPDGSQAEKSGNGLRIFSRYLWDKGLVDLSPFTILTAGGRVVARVHAGGRAVTVQMGTVSFDSTRIPVAGLPREVLQETMSVLGEELSYCAATLGNPHCVILCDDISAQQARRLGPLIEMEARFPNRTNVQFMKILDRRNIQIEIWERGAGYTLASGSSSCAAAAVARRLGYCDADVSVHMPGGVLEVSIGPDFEVTLTGPVTRICEGLIDGEMMSQSRRK